MTEEQEKAVEVLIQVAELAQSRGVLSLKDAAVVLQAMHVLKKEDKVETNNEE